MNSEPSVDISVVVLSYDRPHLLARTLAALERQPVTDGVSFELIVADNHPDRLAESLVSHLKARAAFPIRYLADPQRNYSIVRNIGIKTARGRYVAFVDDDEEPQDGWMPALFGCLERTGGDAAFGRKLPLFETGHPPSWDPTGAFFTTDRREPQDTPIAMFGRRRRPGRGLGSGNSIFRVATCFQDAEPFPTRYGVGNGEDTHLLFKLALEGRRFFWCPEAVVVEFMETQRIRKAYILQRMMRGSQHYAIQRVALSNAKVWMTARVGLLGLAQILVHGVLYAISAPFSESASFAHQVGVAKGVGKLTWRKPIGFIDEAAA